MRKVWVAGALSIVAVLSVVFLTELRSSGAGRRAGGPLACPRDECGRSATGGPVNVGSSASFGPLTLRNDTDEPMTLERVELLDVDPGLQLIGVIVVEPDGRHPLVGSARGYPPSQPGGTTRRVQGYRLEPAESNADFVQILVGLRLRASHRAGARKIAVDYRVGEAQYRAIFDHSMWLCPNPPDPNGCIDPNW